MERMKQKMGMGLTDDQLGEGGRRGQYAASEVTYEAPGRRSWGREPGKRKGNWILVHKGRKELVRGIGVGEDQTPMLTL